MWTNRVNLSRSGSRSPLATDEPVQTGKRREALDGSDGLHPTKEGDRITMGLRRTPDARYIYLRNCGCPPRLSPNTWP